MANLQNSKLLSMILEKAKELGQEYSCKGLPRDYIMVAAIQLLNDPNCEAEDPNEREKALAVIKRYSADHSELQAILESWRNKEAGTIEVIMISKLKNESASAAKSENLSEIPADLFLSRLVKDETKLMAGLHAQDEQPEEKEPEPMKSAGKREENPPRSGEAEKPAEKPAPESLSSIVERTHAELNIIEQLRSQLD